MLRRAIRSGAYAEVWQATDRSGRQFAVKLAAAAPGAADWLRREYRLLAGLAHPAILRADALVDDPDRVALVCEYLAGGDLVSLAGGPPGCWAPAVAEVADALGYLHDRGIAHRDLKARNVMFDGGERARLIDFGSAAPCGARASAAGTTAAHRNPHRAEVAPADDVYALAVLVCQLITGRLPGDRHAVAAQAAQARRDPPSAVADLWSLALQTLAAPDRAAFAPLAAFRDRIKSVLAQQSSCL